MCLQGTSKSQNNINGRNQWRGKRKNIHVVVIFFAYQLCVWRIFFNEKGRRLKPTIFVVKVLSCFRKEGVTWGGMLCEGENKGNIDKHQSTHFILICTASEVWSRDKKTLENTFENITIKKSTQSFFFSHFTYILNMWRVERREERKWERDYINKHKWTNDW